MTCRGSAFFPPGVQHFPVPHLLHSFFPSPILLSAGTSQTDIKKIGPEDGLCQRPWNCGHDPKKAANSKLPRKGTAACRGWGC